MSKPASIRVPSTVMRKKRIYEGTAKSSVSRRKMTPASLYTHYIDMIVGSPTFRQRLEIPRT